MDIYAEVQSSDPADLINSPFGGRYCGPILPRRRISLYRAIALSFFSSKNATSGELFTGRYSFINACEYSIQSSVIHPIYTKCHVVLVTIANSDTRYTVNT